VSQILVVEDNAPLRELWTEALTRAGYQVVSATSAADAFARLATLRADLVLLDLVMPAREINGIELLARLHENPSWATVPVIIVSGIGDSVDRRGAAALGVRNILAKPVDLATLIGEVERAVGPGTPPAPTPPAAPSVPEAPRRRPRVPNPHQQDRSQ
jgi:CheY-like chemotaxis protein